MGAPVIVVPYDHRWPHLYREEARIIRGTAGHMLVALEHIGSTAVPHLRAKPIIDIMAGVPDAAAAECCCRALQGLGYVAKTPGEKDWHFVLSRRASGMRVGYHIHLMSHDSWQWQRHLLFRDYLRTHPDAAEEYACLKSELARQCSDDRVAYTEGKTALIRKFERLARETFRPW